MLVWCRSGVVVCFKCASKPYRQQCAVCKSFLFGPKTQFSHGQAIQKSQHDFYQKFRLSSSANANFANRRQRPTNNKSIHKLAHSTAGFSAMEIICKSTYIVCLFYNLNIYFVSKQILLCILHNHQYSWKRHSVYQRTGTYVYLTYMYMYVVQVVYCTAKIRFLIAVLETHFNQALAQPVVVALSTY